MKFGHYNIVAFNVAETSGGRQPVKRQTQSLSVKSFCVFCAT